MKRDNNSAIPRGFKADARHAILVSSLIALWGLGGCELFSRLTVIGDASLALAFQGALRKALATCILWIVCFIFILMRARLTRRA